MTWTRAHYAAMVLATGWYLLEPHAKENIYGTFDPDLSIPISEWRQVGAYESAEACNNAKLANSVKLPDSNFCKEFPKECTRMSIQALDAECISTDDPRL